MRVLSLLGVLVALNASADAISVELSKQAQQGHGAPLLKLKLEEKLAGYHVALKASGGAVVDVKGGGRVGQTREIPLDHPLGKQHWVGTLTVNYTNGQTAEMALDFDTEVLGPVKITVDKNKDLNLEKHTLNFRLNQPVDVLHFSVLMDTGSYAVDTDLEDRPVADHPMTVTWPEAMGSVMTLTVTAKNAISSYKVELLPWRIDIPHEEVQFDSGKSDIKESEATKLEASLAQINDAIAKYGKLAPIRLFVAGHTDTVGPEAANRVLSFKRAQSICAYFRKKGLKLPILYEGFGEDALNVKTDDEVDEPKNRRAEYIISIEEPAMQNSSIVAKWRKL